MDEQLKHDTKTDVATEQPTEDSPFTDQATKAEKIGLAAGLILAFGILIVLYSLILFSPARPSTAPAADGDIMLVSPSAEAPQPAETSQATTDAEAQPVTSDETEGESVPADANDQTPADVPTDNQSDNSSGSGNGGGSVAPPPADPHAGQTWHPAWDGQVLVSAAWDETVHHPAVYKTVHHDGYWQ